MKKMISILLSILIAISTTSAVQIVALADDWDDYYYEYNDDEYNEEDNNDEEDEEDEDDESSQDDGESQDDLSDEDLEGEDPEEEDDEYTEDQQSKDKANLLAYQYCGDAMFWYVRSNTLYIFGNGQMYNYSTSNPAPWKNKTFSKVVIRAEVESIGEYAFYGMNFSQVNIPSTIAKIGNYAFANNNYLETVELGKDLVSIGNYAFYNCSELENLTINNNLKKIGIGAFSLCASLTYVRFPSTLTAISNSAFKQCTSLSKIILRKGLVKISDYAFYGCSALVEVNIPDTLNEIDSYAFKNCKKISELDFSESVSIIGDSAFENCTSLEELDFGSINTIGTNAFKKSGVKKAIIPSTLKTYDENMFTDCKHVEVYIKKNANVYKKLKAKSNLNVICKEHDNKKLETSKATMTSDGLSDGYICQGCGEKNGLKYVNSIASITISNTSFTYNGKIQTPTVKVVDRAKKTISSSNYTVTYSSGRKNVGKYSVKITFTGNYSGTKILYYTIIPPVTSINSITAISKGFKLSWKKQTSQTTGYQIQYSTSSSFSSAKTVTISKNSTTSKEISNLTGSKKYYVRVRTYKTVSKTNYYSSWSTTKTVTTKK